MLNRGVDRKHKYFEGSWVDGLVHLFLDCLFSPIAACETEMSVYSIQCEKP